MDTVAVATTIIADVMINTTTTTTQIVSDTDMTVIPGLVEVTKIARRVTTADIGTTATATTRMEALATVTATNRLPVRALATATSPLQVRALAMVSATNLMPAPDTAPATIPSHIRGVQAPIATGGAILRRRDPSPTTDTDARYVLALNDAPFGRAAEWRA